MTDELLDDANALSLPVRQDRYLHSRKTNESILSGAGTGLPVGCMTNATTVTVAKEPGSLLRFTLAVRVLVKFSDYPTKVDTDLITDLHGA